MRHPTVIRQEKPVIVHANIHDSQNQQSRFNLYALLITGTLLFFVSYPALSGALLLICLASIFIRSLFHLIKHRPESHGPLPAWCFLLILLGYHALQKG
jgi:hypothetical protein